MIKFEPANRKWWNKPLVKFEGKVMPAELAVLKTVLKSNEEGAWLNSRGTKTGVVGFSLNPPRTVRSHLPKPVSTTLAKLYAATGLSKGCPDLLIWNKDGKSLRFVEVKNPHWDRPSEEQKTFLRIAQQKGFRTYILEWEFARDLSRK